MKIKAQQSHLKQAMFFLAAASANASRSVTEADSSVVHLRGSANGLMLSIANNFDGLGLIYTCEAEVVEGGASNAPCKKLNAMVNALAGEIRLATGKEGGKLDVTTPKSRFSLLTTDKESAIDWKMSGAPLVTIAGQELLRALALTYFAVAASESQHTTNSLCLDVAETTLKVNGTDGHRLAYVEVACEATAKSARLLLRRAAVPLLMRLIEAKPEDPIKLVEQENKLIVRATGWELQVALRDGSYPNYQMALDAAAAGGEHYAALDRERFIDVVTRMTKTCDLRSPGINFEPTPEGLKCSSDRPGEASGEECFAVSGNVLTGERQSFRLNPYYVGQFLRAIDAADIDIYFPKSESGAVCFRPAQGGSECQYLVMPMRS